MKLIGGCGGSGKQDDLIMKMLCLDANVQGWSLGHGIMMPLGRIIILKNSYGEDMTSSCFHVAGKKNKLFIFYFLLFLACHFLRVTLLRC